MIAITADHPPELIHVFRCAVEVSVLIHDKHSESIAFIKELNCGGIMRAAVGVRTHFLEFANTKLPKRIGHGHTHPGMIDMVAGSHDLHRLVIQEESLLRIKPDCAEADLRRYQVGNLI